MVSSKLCQLISIESSELLTHTFFSCYFFYNHSKVVDTKIRLIILFAAKDGEALYSQQKQDQELTVAQIMNSLLQNPDLN